MSYPRRVRPVTLVIAFLLMLTLLFGMVFAAQHQGEKIRFGLVSGAHAFGAAHLLQSASPSYDSVLYSDEDVVLRALDNQLIDAALVSVSKALDLPEDTYALHGVFAVMDLLAVSAEETVLNIGSLSGRTLIMPQKLQGSKEAGMMQKLLDEEDAAGYDMVYAADPVAAYQKTAGSVMLLPMDDLAAALRRDSALSVRFRLSQQWRTSFLSVAPAGWCIVYRRDIADTSTFRAFEKALRDSMLYADRKRKKTIAMAVASDLFADEATADQLIDHLSFSYLEDEEMRQAIAAYQTL